MNRRTFVIGAVGGALMVGCGLGPSIARHYKRTGVFQPNAWLRIAADGTITFVLDRVEMGQGTMTSHAQLVAEELEVDPRTLAIELAEADHAYDNPRFHVQITGGSSSTATSWQPLREAGAVAREMLRAAAAARWNVPHAACIAADGVVAHPATKRRATYGELAGEAAARPVPARVALKDPKAFRVIGTSVDRLDARAKIDGSGVYGIDVRMPGLATAVIVRPPRRGARVARVDDRAARARRGVTDVIDLGDGVAVVATGYWQARRGAEALVVEWTGGLAVDTPALVAAFERMARAGGGEITRSVGDVSGAELNIAATYAVPYLAHATMEPQNATAWLHDGRCEIWAPTQAPGIARARVAEAIGMPLDAVAIHATLIGGGFGRRGLVDYCVEAARVAQRAKRPVKVVWSREDDLANDWYRPMAVSAMRGAVANGAITGWLHRLVTQSILASEGGDLVVARVPDRTPRPLRALAARIVPRLTTDPSAAEGATEIPYAIPNLRVELVLAETGVPVGFWRSVGHSHTAFVVESFLDELAHAAGLDPVAARRTLLARQPRLRAVLELCAKQAGWGAPLPAGVGRGIAVHESSGTSCAQVVEASVAGARVIVRRVVVAIDCGRVVNPGIVAQQVESAVIFGLSAALGQRVTFAGGRVQETNFDSYRMLRMFECPVIETNVVDSTEPPTGVGEPGVPPVAPALGNAIFAATGKRLRALPFDVG